MHGLRGFGPFYETLGLTRIVDAPPRYARFETPGGETLSLHAVDAVSSTTVVYFEVDDVDAVVLNLTAKGLVLDQPPRDERWLWREARLRDPAGNEICLSMPARTGAFHRGEWNAPSRPSCPAYPFASRRSTKSSRS